VRAWDFAATTKSSSDYTTAVKLVQVRPHGSDTGFFWAVADVQRGRWGPEEVERMLLTLARADGHSVAIRIPKHPGSAGVSHSHAYIRLLTGFSVKAVHMTGSKKLRAHLAAAQSNIGRIGVLRAPWTAAFLDELAAFLSGRHDD
jgi:predicted phage terminase large subunit-like protein